MSTIWFCCEGVMSYMGKLGFIIKVSNLGTEIKLKLSNIQTIQY